MACIRANKYAMLEEDLQAATSFVLASTQTTQARKDVGNKHQGPSNPSQGKKLHKMGKPKTTSTVDPS